MPSLCIHPADAPGRRSQGGYSLVEVAFGLVIVAVGLMTQFSSTMGQHKLSVEQRHRASAMHGAEQVVELLRAEEDWPGLYDRLWDKLVDAETPGELNPGEVRLEDGRRAFAPQDYFATFVSPPMLDQLHLLLEVPGAELDGAPELGPVLREDLASPSFGLPADLNLDGAVDGAARDDDYLVLPVRVHLRWTVPGEAPRELSLVTWVRGTR